MYNVLCIQIKLINKACSTIDSTTTGYGTDACGVNIL